MRVLEMGKYHIWVSDEDGDLLDSYKWSISGPLYCRYIRTHTRGGATRGLHSMILERKLGFRPPIWCVPDHKSHSLQKNYILDNRRENIRPANAKMNALTKRKFRGTSKYIGIAYYYGKYVANVCGQKKNFVDECEAAAWASMVKTKNYQSVKMKFYHQLIEYQDKL